MSPELEQPSRAIRVGDVVRERGDFPFFALVMERIPNPIFLNNYLVVMPCSKAGPVTISEVWFDRVDPFLASLLKEQYWHDINP